MKNALALIIGNNNYALEPDRLNNAVNDANHPETLYRLKSVKHENIELLHSAGNRPHSGTEVQFSGIAEQLKLKLARPSQYLHLSTNVDQAVVKYISIPWNMKLSRAATTIVEKQTEF